LIDSFQISIIEPSTLVSPSVAFDDWAALSEGAYLLRSNITDWSDQQLWKAYIPPQMGCLGCPVLVPVRRDRYFIPNVETTHDRPGGSEGPRGASIVPPRHDNDPWALGIAVTSGRFTTAFKNNELVILLRRR
jgi:hypothetical protein